MAVIDPIECSEKNSCKTTIAGVGYLLVELGKSTCNLQDYPKHEECSNGKTVPFFGKEYNLDSAADAVRRDKLDLGKL